jgi:hypothetical protein
LLVAVVAVVYITMAQAVVAVQEDCLLQLECQ